MTSAWLDAPLMGARVMLRLVQPGDETALVGLMTDPEVRRYIGGPREPEEARASIYLDDIWWGSFVVAQVSDDEVVGTLSFARKRGPWEVSFQLRADLWGQGLMSEALMLALCLVPGLMETIKPRRIKDGCTAEVSRGASGASDQVDVGRA